MDLLRLYMGRLLRLQVEDNHNRSHCSRGSIGVTLIDEAEDCNDVVCINNEMIKHKFAVSFG